jgi:hypothetical protein
VYKISHDLVDVIIFYVLVFGVVIWPDAISQYIRQRDSIKCYKNIGKSAKDTLAMVRQDNVSRTRMFEWHVQTHRNRIKWDRWRASEEHTQNCVRDQEHCSQKILPGRPNSQFRTLLLRLMATAWKCVKTSPQLWRQENRLLHHDNAQSHTFVSTKKFFTKNNRLSSPTHLTFLCLPDWRSNCKAVILTQVRRSKQNRRRCWVSSQNTA